MIALSCCFEINSNDTKILIITNYTFLGIYINNKLNFKLHIDQIIWKILNIIYVLNRLSNFISTFY